MSKTSSTSSVLDLLDLTGKIALVTGGGGHLGAAFASALAEAGALVVVTSRDQGRATQAAAALPNPSGKTHVGVVLDHMETDSIEQCLETITQQVGPIDILVNNGHDPTAQPIDEAIPEDFTRQLANATGYFELARHIRNSAARRNASASIIMIGSMYGIVGSYPDAYEGICPASPVAYHTLKGGIIHLTRHLAVYWAKDRVRVNCLSPGPFPAETVSTELRQRLEAKSPLGRMGSAHELKGALLLLASDAGSYITGQNIVVDGGWTAW